MKNYYILSQDVGILFGKWAKRQGFNIPEPSYFDAMVCDTAADIQALLDDNKKGTKVKIIFAKDLIRETKKLIGQEEDELIVSLERAYFDCDFHLEVSRSVQREGSNWIDLGECPRPGCKSLDKQIGDLIHKAKGREIIIIDDGCWTGSSIEKIVNALRLADVRIKKIVFGIMIDRGRVRVDIPLNSAYVFPEETVIDWICERDFVPGTPLGGKTLFEEKRTDSRSVGAYYLFGMGDYSSWASLDFSISEVKWFTRRRIHQAAKLFEEISMLSGRPVLFEHVERIPSCFGDSRGVLFSKLLRQQGDDIVDRGNVI